MEGAAPYRPDMIARVERVSAARSQAIAQRDVTRLRHRSAVRGTAVSEARIVERVERAAVEYEPGAGRVERAPGIAVESETAAKEEWPLSRLWRW